MPLALSAQTVRGVVTDQLDRPLTGVVVQLTDSTSRTVMRALTNERGEFRLTAPADGRYQVRSTRIGFRPTTTDPIALTAAAEVTRRVTLVSNPVMLQPVRSTVRTTCRSLGLDSTAATFAAWEQVRAALTAADVTAENSQLVTTTLSYERRQTLNGLTLRQMGTVSTAVSSRPWVSLSADSLRKTGYVVTEAGTDSRTFHGPDMRVLGSDAFIEDHCFRIVAASDTSRIGIAFEPTPQRKDLPEIQGTMWLDRASSELREMEWQYLNIAKNVDETATGGAMHFARLGNGAWLISRWSIRMPLLEMGASNQTQVVVFRGIKVVGGELVAATSASGQDTLWAGPKMTLHGFAFDSLSKKTMTSALVGIAGTNRTAITDSAGRFAFGDLPPGAYRLITQHDALEAIGLPYQATTAVLTSDGDTVNITMPSFETIWRLACESAPPGRDTALVYGTIRGLGRPRPVAGASVIATWIDVAMSGKKKIDTKRWHLDGQTDSTGSYVLCGLPTQTGLRMRAVADSAESGLIDLPPLVDRLVERRDLTISYDPNSRGVVAGKVVGRNSSPIGGARIIADGVQEVRTDAQGRFVLRDVPLGTQQIEVLAVGLQPVARIVDVSPNDTARIELHVTKPVVLQRVNIVASSIRQQFISDFNARREKGLGQFRDSTVIGGYGTLNGALSQMQGIKMMRDKIYLPRPAGECIPAVWIDGVHVQSTDDLMALRPNDIAAIELYTRELMTPMQFIVKGSRAPNCGAIVAWTKWYFEGNRGSPPPS